MIWLLPLSLLIAVLALAGLYGSIHTRRDLATRRPSYITIGDHTGVWDRDELARLLGAPDHEDCYQVESEELARLPRARWHRWLDNDLVDVGCLVAAGASIALALQENWSGASWLLLIAGAYQVASWTVASLVVARYATFRE